MEYFSPTDQKVFSSKGVESSQLINPENSKSERLTITKVVVESGEVQARHQHVTSEQIWIAIQGHGKLLLENDIEKSFNQGDVVRFADNDVHGLHNDSEQDFIYISVTSPPLNFRAAYNSAK